MRIDLRGPSSRAAMVMRGRSRKQNRYSWRRVEIPDSRGDPPVLPRDQRENRRSHWCCRAPGFGGRFEARW